MLVPTLTFDDADEALRREVREWIQANDPGASPASYAGRMERLIEWQRALGEAGYVGASWDAKYGGRGLGLTAEAVIAEELAQSSMPQLVNRIAVYTWGPTLLDFGTEQQKRTYLPGMLDASEIWCQGFSEPGAGSDLAAVKTIALRDGDELVVNGQKLWTSRAELSKYNALLVRSDPSAERHSGLSILIVDMHSPGITIRPLPQMLDEPHFSEVFFDDVRVPAANVIGDLNGGWRIAMHAMGYERGLFVLERMIRLRRRLGDLVEELRVVGAAESAAGPIGRLHAHLEVLRAQVYRTLAAQRDNSLEPGSTSIDKLFMSELYQELFATAFDQLGEAPAITDDGWARDLLESRSVTIYSGTSEIQKNIIARQLLGLR